MSASERKSEKIGAEGVKIKFEVRRKSKDFG